MCHDLYCIVKSCNPNVIIRNKILEYAVNISNKNILKCEYRYLAYNNEDAVNFGHICESSNLNVFFRPRTIKNFICQ